MSLIGGAFDAYHPRSQEEDADGRTSMEQEAVEGGDGGRWILMGGLDIDFDERYGKGDTTDKHP
jgi:hypothetical protein